MRQRRASDIQENSSSESTEILSGVRILEFGRFISGPYCGWLLASLGAEVIRVEPPGGEMDRHILLPTEIGQPTAVLTYSCGKKCITIDFAKGERSRQLFSKLVAKSDVVIQNLGPGYSEAWGLTYEQLSKIKPDIIVANITAYGTTGPYKDRIGFDSIAQAMSGGVNLTGLPENPIRSTVAYVDFGTATHCAWGVVSALLHRYKTGKGQKIEVSLLRSAVTWTSHIISEYVKTGKVREPRRIGNRAYWNGFTDLCETKDGKLVAMVIPGPLLRRLFRAIGRPDLVNDPRFDTDLKAFQNVDQLDSIIKPWVASKTLEELEEIALRLRLPLGPVLDYIEVPGHPQIEAESMLIDATLSGGTFTMPVPACPVRFSKGAMRDNLTIPKVGEHNEDTWGRLCGLSSQELTSLKDEGVI